MRILVVPDVAVSAVEVAIACEAGLISKQILGVLGQAILLATQQVPLSLSMSP